MLIGIKVSINQLPGLFHNISLPDTVTYILGLDQCELFFELLLNVLL